MSIRLIDHFGRNYDIVSDRTTIGPSARNSVVIPEMSGQGTILNLERSGGYWQLTPVDSGVAMELNGVAAWGTQFLRHMDTVQANGVVLHFVDLDSTGTASHQRSTTDVSGQAIPTDPYRPDYPPRDYQEEHPSVAAQHYAPSVQPAPPSALQVSDDYAPLPEQLAPESPYAGTPTSGSSKRQPVALPLDKKSQKRLAKKYGTDVVNLQTSYALSARHAGTVRAEYIRLLNQRGLPNTQIEETDEGIVVITQKLDPRGTQTTSTAVLIAAYGNDLLVELHHFEFSAKVNTRLMMIRTVLITIGVMFFWTGVGLLFLIGGIAMLFSKGKFPEPSTEQQAATLLFATVLETLETALVNSGINPNAQLSPVV